jgi:hypothetical protein
MARDGHALSKVSPGPAMHYPSTPCRRTTTKTAPLDNSGVAGPQGWQLSAVFYPFGHRMPMFTYIYYDSRHAGEDDAHSFLTFDTENLIKEHQVHGEDLLWPPKWRHPMEETTVTQALLTPTLPPFYPSLWSDTGPRRGGHRGHKSRARMVARESQSRAPEKCRKVIYGHDPAISQSHPKK